MMQIVYTVRCTAVHSVALTMQHRRSHFRTLNKNLNSRKRTSNVKQVSAVADEPTRCTASLQMCCKQRWMSSEINL